jgi:hypothetical protein
MHLIAAGNTERTEKPTEKPTEKTTEKAHVRTSREEENGADGS